MAKGCFAFEPFAFLEASAQSGQFGVGTGLIDEDQSCLLLTHDGLTALDPFYPRLGNVRPVLLACQKAFFYS
jgi:hypothetical protein